MRQEQVGTQRAAGVSEELVRVEVCPRLISECLQDAAERSDAHSLVEQSAHHMGDGDDVRNRTDGGSDQSWLFRTGVIEARLHILDAE
jgi:hypothetical protein